MSFKSFNNQNYIVSIYKGNKHIIHVNGICKYTNQQKL